MKHASHSSHPQARPTTALAALALAALAPAARPQGVKIGFEEEFALALDRAAAVERLIPGTPEAYWYRCLERQHAGDLAAVDALLEAWVQRHGRDARVEELENRQALLRFTANPRATYEHLRQRLGASFSYFPEVPGAKPDLPVRLDPSAIAYETLARRALAEGGGTLSGFTPAGLERVAERKLDERQLADLLERLERPDLPRLAALVVRDLQEQKSRGFGSRAIHTKLLLAQLEECAEALPSLLDDKSFVATWIERLAPLPDEDIESDAAARLAYLERLEAFTKRLSPVHNSLKAHVLHHRLKHDLAAGRPDRERLRAYLRLPRRASYVHPRLLEGSRDRNLADLGAKFQTDLDPVGDDEPLVRAYLMHFLRGATSASDFAEWIEPRYLSRVLAETNILAGLGDMERWYSLFDDPAYYEALLERVELDFPPEQTRWFEADAPVRLALDVKNVRTLLVEVYEIDAAAFYAAQDREIDASIELEGLVANVRRSFDYEEPPLRRVRRSFDFPELAGPGVFVVDFIGGGRASRAVIHKGSLRLRERVGAAGHVLRVVDERGRPQPQARARFAGRRYEADERGEILIPFSTDPGRKSIVLEAAGRASLAFFEHRQEEYQLQADFFVEREALRSGERAKLLLRASLTASGEPAGLRLLESPVLQIHSTDLDGVSSAMEVRELALSAEGELVHEFAVPPRLSNLRFELSGSVKSLTSGEPVELRSSSRDFPLSTIAATEYIASPLLGRSAEGWFLDVLGRSGEPIADQVVELRLEHGDFTQPVTLTLKTDAAGRIQLGALEGIRSLAVAGLPHGIRPWALVRAERTQPSVLTAVAGQTLRIPYAGSASALSRAELSLIELRGGRPYRDAFASASLVGGWIELRGLAPAAHALVLKESGETIHIEVVAGVEREGVASSPARSVELPRKEPLHLVELGVREGELRLALANATQEARVHLFATRYLPAHDIFQLLRPRWRSMLRELSLGLSESDLRAGREIGDEYRYVLERRLARKFPGNMLRRPSLILNPFALDESVTAIGAGGAKGGRFQRSGGGAGAPSARPAAIPTPPPDGGTAGSFADLDFLSGSRPLLANLRPDAQGRIALPLAELGDGQLVHVLVLDREHAHYATLALPERARAPRDLRLAEALDPGRAFTLERRIEFLGAGAEATIEDRASARVELYQSLADVHRLFRALSGEAELERFAFLLRWPKLSAAEKRELYSQHACHELHLFLAKKDPAFFEEVVRPYLANKLDPAFVDRWLLGEDLSGYLEPWAFAQLNALERILLARRITERAPGIARQLRELLELVPPDRGLADRRFEALLAGRALAAERGLAAELGEAWSAETAATADRQLRARAKGPAAPAPGLAGDDFFVGRVVEMSEELDGAELDLKDAEAADEARREEVKLFFRAVGPTRTFAEQGYWKARRVDETPERVRVNAFWLDLAECAPGAPFVSEHVAEATGSLCEMLLALALLDLPFEAGEHAVQVQENRSTLRAASPLLLVREERRELGTASDARPLLVSQDFYRLDEPVRYEGVERVDAFVREGFVAGLAYGCRIVLSNPTASPRELELFVQIPSGSIPLQKSKRSRGLRLRLEPFGAAGHEYAFYFPSAGSFAHYPAQVAEGGARVAAALAQRFEVAAEPPALDPGSWAHLSQRGSLAEVLQYLRKANLQRVDLARIAWRMRERSAYDALLGLLRERFTYHPLLWSFALLHEDATGTREHLRHQNHFLGRCGRWIDTPLLSIDPLERRAFEHLEFDPLVNPRAHRFGRQREILNLEVARQYRELLAILAYRPALDGRDWLLVTYHLLLQDRVEEALQTFARVDPKGLHSRLQYDYLDAWLAFSQGELGRAREIAARHREHPVTRWRALFQDAWNQLEEAEGAASLVSDPRNREQRQGQLASEEPALALRAEGRTLRIAAQNVPRCELAYFPMDIEFLFSTSPFVQEASKALAFIRPHRLDVLELPASGELALEIPPELSGSNLLVEARAAGLVRRVTVLASSLSVQWIESYGELRVSESASGRAVPKAYVKVFARLPNGQVRFHKDGYTDLRGRFDYASLSGAGAADVERFAVLVLSDTQGAALAELAPPAR